MDEPHRRKLIKGTLSAPLVLTVGKAGAAARTTFAACLHRAADRPDPPLAATSPDEALRVTRDVFEVWQGGAHKRQKLAGRYVVGWDNETLFRLEDNGFTQSLHRMAGMHARAADVELEPVGKAELLAYVDDEGNVVGIAPQDNGGTWVMHSCYASIAARPRDPRRLFG